MMTPKIGQRVARICIFGPESTGKSTLARRLAAHFGGVCVTEQAQAMIAAKGGQIDYADMPAFARAQEEAENAAVAALERDAAAGKTRGRAGTDGMVFCDSDALTTQIWSDVLFGQCPPEVAEAARRMGARYAHTLLLDIDVPWVDDVHRVDEKGRAEFLALCVAALKAQGRDYTLVGGDFEARFQSACNVMEKLLRLREEQDKP